MNSTLLLSLVQVLTGALQNNPNVPKGIGQIAGDAGSSVAAILAAIHSGSGDVALNPATILAAIGGVISALQSDPNLPQNVLAKLQSLNNAVQAGLAADATARQTVDPSTLKHIDPIP